MFRAEHQRADADLGTQVHGDHRRRRPRPRRADQRGRARSAVAGRMPRTASCSTATRATSARSTTSTPSSPARGEALDAVIQLVVPRDESIARLTLRAQEQGRTDDTEEVIAQPSRDLRARDGSDPRGLPRPRHRRLEIDGVGSLDEITERIVAALARARADAVGRRLSRGRCSAGRSTRRPPSCGRWSSPGSSRPRRSTRCAR